MRKGGGRSAHARTAPTAIPRRKLIVADLEDDKNYDDQTWHPNRSMCKLNVSYSSDASDPEEILEVIPAKRVSRSRRKTDTATKQSTLESFVHSRATWT